MPVSVDTYEAGRSAWPGITLDRAVFERYVDERVPERDRGSVRAAELYLACACAGGDERAIAEFERRYLTEVPTFLARHNPSEHLLDDVRQQLRERLFVEGKIEQYTGRGTLASWLRVVTLRVTSNLRRQDRHHAELDTAIAGAGSDPELDLVRRRYGQEFQTALRDALAALGPEERTLLRLHYLDGLNIDRIAVIFQVSRATVGRRMLALRERLVADTERLLRERLGTTAGELESILRVIRSDLAMSLSVVLGGRCPNP
jgi:RNA polymerase sigma-70 factor (ECF subfamily)